MAGFQQFDPDKWEPQNEAEGVAKVAKAAKVDPALASLATLAGVHAAGVQSLDPARPPRGAKPEAWACAVRDAKALMRDGWAEQALALGWSALDLFGGNLDPKGDYCSDGLAVWLAGRRVVAVSATGAAAESKSEGRAYFHIPRAPGARLLWAMSGGR